MLQPAKIPDKFRKSAHIIRSKDSGLSKVVEWRLFNYLYAKCLPDIDKKQIHTIPLREVVDHLNSTPARIRECLKTMGEASITLQLTGEGGEQRTVTAHYLSYDVSHEENGLLYIAFDPILRSVMKNPDIYAELSLIEQRKLQTTHANALYERLCLIVNQIHPYWEPGMDELKAYLGAEDMRTDNFMRNKIGSAVDEINQYTLLQVSYEPKRTGRGGVITSVLFKASTLSGDALVHKNRQVKGSKGKKGRRDEQTVDLFLGASQADIGKISDISHSAKTRALAILGGFEPKVAEAIIEWKAANKGKTIKDADESFLQFLEMKADAANDAILSGFSADVIGDLLDGDLE